MSTLNQIEKMDDRRIQDWLRKADPTTLAIALIDASAEVKSRIVKNMSKHAGAVLKGCIDGYSAMDARTLLIRKCAKELEALMEESE